MDKPDTGSDGALRMLTLSQDICCCYIIQCVSFLSPSPSAEWPSCRRRTSWRSCWKKSRSSTRNSHSSIPKFLILFLCSQAEQLSSHKKYTNPSAFPTTALAVSAMTHSSLYSCLSFGHSHTIQKALYCVRKQNWRWRNEIKRRVSARYKNNGCVCGFSFEGCIACLCICEYER